MRVLLYATRLLVPFCLATPRINKTAAVFPTTHLIGLTCSAQPEILFAMVHLSSLLRTCRTVTRLLVRHRNSSRARLDLEFSDTLKHSLEQLASIHEHNLWIIPPIAGFFKIYKLDLQQFMQTHWRQILVSLKLTCSISIFHQAVTIFIRCNKQSDPKNIGTQ